MESVNCIPVSVAMAATWDPELVNGIGSAIGRETRGKGRHVILGQQMCKHCSTVCRWAEEILKALAKILS